MNKKNRAENQLRNLMVAITLVALATSARSQAAGQPICVSTSQELQDTLTLYSDGGPQNGNDLYISLAQGTYKTGAATGNKPFHYSSTASSGLISISGGRGANCNGYTGDPSLAKLDGNGATQVLRKL